MISTYNLLPSARVGGLSFTAERTGSGGVLPRVAHGTVVFLVAKRSSSTFERRRSFDSGSSHSCEDDSEGRSGELHRGRLVGLKKEWGVGRTRLVGWVRRAVAKTS